MPIADSTLILEGQQDFSGGMDSSLSPTLINGNSVATAVNVTFRGGRPSSRPGFRQVSLVSGTNAGLDILTNQYFQGSAFYLERRQNFNSCIIGVFGGNVIKIDLGSFETSRVYPLDGSGNPVVGTAMDPFEKCFFVQAEKYMIIQNGQNVALIWDGDNLYRSGVGPAGSTGAVSQLHTLDPGTIMAYGQGRLFVASPDRTEITAGDLVYGGSTEQVTITSGTATTATSAVYTITTASAHGFVPGDVISIYGHSSSNGANGTWTCATGTTGSTLVIDLANTTSTVATGTGGYAAKANVGMESDLLRFTETTYLAEGGALQVPSFTGRINAMIFMPVQDTTTGQGDLLVFCDRGTASFAVSTPRDQWKSVAAFQRVVFQSIGATGPTCLATDNGDVFFRSFDGLRSYRNARAEINSFGQVPISAEMNSVLNFDTKSLLTEVSAITFDNRLLFTASPSIDYSGLNPAVATRQPVTFSKIVALDFTTLSTVGAKRAASYDGVWGGLNVLQLVSGLVNGRPEAFVFAYDFTNERLNAMWRITTDAPFDYPLATSSQRIQSIIETRAFSFGSPSEQKKMIRADFWLSDILGRVDVDVYWRPDQYPCWKNWHAFSRCATVDNCIDPGVTYTVNTDGTSTLCFSSASPSSFFYKLGKDGVFTEPLQYVFSDNPLTQSDDLKNALIAAGFTVGHVARTGDFPNYCFTIGTGDLPNWEDYTLVPRNWWENMTVIWDAPYSPGGPSTSGLKLTFLPVKLAGDSSCLSNFTAKNLQPQYRPQIRMPTPPEATDPIISRPFTYGNDFQLRLELTGHFELNRILMLGQRILEQYQGTDTLEVL
jgi:hypothetical protein